MTPDELRALIAQDENPKLEFKIDYPFTNEQELPAEYVWNPTEQSVGCRLPPSNWNSSTIPPIWAFSMLCKVVSIV